MLKLEINQEMLNDVSEIARRRREIGKKYVIGKYICHAGESITEKAHSSKGVIIFYSGHVSGVEKGICEIKIGEETERINLYKNVVTIVTIPPNSEYVLLAITKVVVEIQYEFTD